MTAEDLRKSILQQAIQGKLVPQDPNDEPAAVLLERIREEKARLIKEKKIKNDKNESIIFRGDDNSYYEKILATGEVKCIDDEIPFEIPESWEWERWGNISQSIQYGYNAPALKSGDVRMVRISDIQNGKVLWESVPYCNIQESEIANYLLLEDDILFARTGGTVGKSFLVTETPYPAIFAGYLIRTRYSKLLYAKYMKFFMESELYWNQLREGTIATAQPNCNGKTLGKMLLPIPPYLEQDRIVRKIEQITTVLNKYQEASEKLNSLDSCLNEDLKKSILQYAIQGKLVPQIDTEEPATILLEQIRAEKLQLLKQGKLKKKDIQESFIFRGDDNRYYEKVGKVITDITEDLPFEIPESWQWSRLSNIANLYTGNSINEAEKNARYTNVQGTEYIATKDVKFDNSIDYQNGVAIPNQYVANFRIAPAKSVLMCIEGGSAGRKIGILDQEVCFGNKLCCFAPYTDISEYIFYYLQSPLFFEIFSSNKNGIIGGVSVNNLKQLFIPLPPLNEITRIVNKIKAILKSIEG